MVTSLAVILLVPIGLFIARFFGFSPKTQVYTALKTILANLCWLPPLSSFFKGKALGLIKINHLKPHTMSGNNHQNSFTTDDERKTHED